VAAWISLDDDIKAPSYPAFARIEVGLGFGVSWVVPYLEWVDAEGVVQSTHRLGDIAPLPSWIACDDDRIAVPTGVDPGWFMPALLPPLKTAAKAVRPPSGRRPILYLPTAWTLRDEDRTAAEGRISVLTYKDRRAREALWSALGRGTADDLWQRLPGKVTAAIDAFIDPGTSGHLRVLLVALDAQVRQGGGAVDFEDDPLINEVFPRRARSLKMPARQRSARAQESLGRQLETVARMVEDDEVAQGLAYWRHFARSSNEVRCAAMAARAHALVSRLYHAAGDEIQGAAHRGWGERVDR